MLSVIYLSNQNMKTWRDWLFVFREETGCVALAEENLHALINELPSPDTQFPSLALIVGQHEKHKFLTTSYVSYKTTSKAVAQVHVANTTIVYPTVIVDVSVNEMYSGTRPVRTTTLQRRTVADWLSDSASYKLERLVDSIFQQLMHHFIDVVCLFLDDFPAPEAAFEQLQRWTGPASTFANPCKPRLLIISSKQTPKRCFKSAAFSNIRYLRTQQKALPQRTLAIEKAIDLEINRVRSNRINCQLLFSAPHMNALIRHALQALAQSAPSPLDLCRLAYSSVVNENFPECLEIFLQICQDAADDIQFVTSYLASALLLLSRPPNMHRKSTPCYSEAYD